MNFLVTSLFRTHCRPKKQQEINNSTSVLDLNEVTSLRNNHIILKDHIKSIIFMFSKLYNLKKSKEKVPLHQLFVRHIRAACSKCKQKLVLLYLLITMKEAEVLNQLEIP